MADLPRGGYCTSLADVQPDLYYSATDLSGIALSRGVALPHLLSRDPLAPAAVKRGTALLRLGADVLAYCASAEEWAIRDGERLVRAQLDAGLASLRTRAVEIEREIAAAADRRVAAAVRDMRERVEGVLAEITRDVTPAANLRCGVYMLYLDGALQYVGQSVNVHARVQEHRRRKTFDMVRFLPAPRERLNDLEGFLIRLLRPPQNGYGGDPTFAAPVSSWWEGMIELP